MKKIVFGIVILILISCKKDIPNTNEVFMEDSKFNPSSITVSAGTTITWTNKEKGIYVATHTVTSDNNTFSSGDIERKKTFTYAFTTPGTYTYHCNHHNGMTGIVIVQ